MLSSKVLADAIQPRIKAGDVVEINGEYEAGSTLGFYLRRQVRILNGRSSDLWYGSFFNDAPHLFDDDASFRQLWSGPQRIFLWTEQDHVPTLPGPAYAIAQQRGQRDSEQSAVEAFTGDREVRSPWLRSAAVGDARAFACGSKSIRISACVIFSRRYRDWSVFVGPPPSTACWATLKPSLSGLVPVTYAVHRCQS